MNMQIFRLINNMAHKSKILDEIMIAFTNYVPMIFIAITVIVFIIGLKDKKVQNRKIAVSTVIFAAINLFISFIIGNIYFVNRPFVNNKVNLLVQHSKDASFPSDHAIGTMSIALGLKKYNKIISTILMLLSIIVGFSRVYVGNHYPFDVLGGYVIAIITSYIYNKILRDIIEENYEIIEKKIFLTLGFRNLYNEI